MEKVAKGAVVVLGPIAILFLRRIVQIWFARKGAAEEKTLQKLLKDQRAKVEELKKKTNYYSTRDLLQRYEESGTPSNSPLRAIPPNPATPSRAQQPSLLKQPPSFQASQPMPTAPAKKQWLDKLADALLGEDQTPDSATSKYALICEKCLGHNGLVKEDMWENAQYICPKCNHFNQSARAKKQGASRSEPASSVVTSPVSPVAPTTPVPIAVPTLSPVSGARSSTALSSSDNHPRQRRSFAQSGASERGDGTMMDLDS